MEHCMLYSSLSVALARWISVQQAGDLQESTATSFSISILPSLESKQISDG